MRKELSMTKEMLMALDEKFDLETSTGGAETWASYFAEEGVLVVGQGKDIVGRENIKNAMKPALDNEGNSLRWAPISGDISEDGTLGYTFGAYVRKNKNKDGQIIHK
jgi:ketosteroid isomerase-like protein